MKRRRMLYAQEAEETDVCVLRNMTDAVDTVIAMRDWYRPAIAKVRYRKFCSRLSSRVRVRVRVSISYSYWQL